MLRPAVFFDRDGTLIESVHYLNRRDQVRLLPGAAQTLARLSALGYLNILVTNQAAIGKGLLSVDGLRDIQAEFDRQLADQGAKIDAWYFSPHTKKGDDREAVEHFDRKPGPGMLLRAAVEHQVLLPKSWMVGDMVSDTLAGRNAGCRTVLVRTGLADYGLEKHPSVDRVVDSIRDLPVLIEAEERARGAGRTT